MSRFTSRSNASDLQRNTSDERQQIEFIADLSQILASIPGNEWIDKLKFAYSEADIHNNDRLSLRHWLNSRLRFVISDRILSDDEMEDYFSKIDTDLDGFIRFEELENYLISHQGSVTQMDINKVAHLSYKLPHNLPVSKLCRSEKCLKSMFIPSTIQILTLSESTFSIWEPSTCLPIKQFSDKDKFVDFCFMPTLFNVVIAKQNRQIIFFNIRKLQKVDFIISAALDSQKILKMTLNESYDALKHVAKNKVPIFNAPTSIAADPMQTLIYIGDDTGKIEVFDIHPARHSKTGFGFTRLSAERLHSGSVSQILYLEPFENFVSCSLDGSIQMWSYDSKLKKFTRHFTFFDPLNYSILSMVFDSRTRDIIYNTSNHSICSWKVKTRNRISVSTPNNVTTLAVFQYNENTSYLITVSADHFFTTYQMPSFDQSRNWFIGTHHEYCTPTSSLIIGDELYLAGGYLSTWRIEIGDEDIINPHSGNIVATIVNDEMQRILTLDQKGNQVQWNMLNGIKQYRSCYIAQKKLYLNCANVDKQGRKLGVGFSNGCFQIISMNSGTILCDMDNRYCIGGCNYIEFGTLFGIPRVFCATGNQSVVVFDEIHGNRVRFLRSFIGHTENVMSIIILKDVNVLTIGTGHELFLWSLSQNTPITKFELKNDPTTAVDLPEDPEIFIVGDVVGMLYFISIKTNTIINTLNPFHMVIRSGISCLSVIDELGLLCCCNAHGYTVFYTIDGGKMIEKRFFRSHTQSVLSLSYSSSLNCLVSFGRDEEIRLWSMKEPFGLIGELNKPKKWKIENPATYLGDDNIDFNEKDFEENQEIKKFENQLKAIRCMHHMEQVKSANINNLEPVNFSLSLFNEVMSQAEDQLNSGRIIVKKLSMKPEDVPPSKKLKPPPPRNLRFDALLNDDDLIRTTKYYSRVKNRASKSPLEIGNKDKDKNKKKYQYLPRIK